MIRFILASQSPRRRELMRLLGYPFSIEVADADEGSVTNADPALNVVETARLKVKIVAGLQKRPFPNRTIILAADTIVALDGQMLGKPANVADAHDMLVALRGRQHAVHTGFALFDLNRHVELTGVHTATVTMRPYRDDEITTYIASGDPMDKAGAYAIQHPQFRPVADLNGCYLGVMGLSICHLLTSLKELETPQNADLTAVALAHRQYACPLLADQMQKSSK